MFMPRPPARPQKKTAFVLRVSLAATLAYVVVTLVAGLRAHSLALLSESGHNASDFLALLLSFVAVYFHSRPADDAKTFGYQPRRRAGRIYQRRHSYRHLSMDWRRSRSSSFQPGSRAAASHDVRGRSRRHYERRYRRAAVGRGPRRQHALGFIHMAGDNPLHRLPSSPAAAAILFTPALIRIDPVLSLLIAALILWSSYGIVRENPEYFA